MELTTFIYAVVIINGFVGAHVIIDANLSLVCQRMPYIANCSDGKQSQFTIRWFVKDNICTSYSYGYCFDPMNNTTKDTTFRTKQACESMCVKNDTLPILKTKVTLLVSSLRSPDVLFFNNYSCERRPFRRTCASGLPSKFTFRWYFDGGSCLAYPYGYCKEVDDSEHVKAPKTRQICELFCNGTNVLVPPPFPTPKSYSFNDTDEPFQNSTVDFSTSQQTSPTTLSSTNLWTQPFVSTTPKSGTSKKLPGLLALEDDPILGSGDAANETEKQKFASSFDFERGYVRRVTKIPKDQDTNFTGNAFDSDLDFSNGTSFNLTNFEDFIPASSFIIV